MLELRNLSRYYVQKKGPTVKALDNVSLRFDEKGIVFVLGKSGSGKSTLLNVIGGLDKYTDGDLLISGKSTKQFKQSEFDSYRNTMVGFIFQEYNVLDEFTVSQNIGIALELQGKKVTDEAINEMLDLFDLSGLGGRKPNTLSGGQKQRVAIARALVKNPDIIMADEPTGALDSATGKQLFETLTKLAQERLVIVVSHDRDFAETYGDRIIEFKDGQIVRDVTKVKPESKEKQNNLVFTNKGIEIAPRYELTAEDLAVINEYLRTNEAKETLITKGATHSFIETVASEVKESKDIPFIKSRLPFLSSLKMGTSALKHKKVRLVFSIILASLSFSMFGVSDTMAAFDKQTAMTDSIIDTNVEYAAVTKRAGLYSYHQISLNNDDIKMLNDLDPSFDFAPLISFSFSFNDNFVTNVNDEHSYYRIRPSSAINLKSNELSRFGFSLLEDSRLPVADNEIAITNYAFEQFVKLKYKDSVTNITSTITRPNDLLNKTIHIADDEVYTIVGVIDTGFKKADYEYILSITDYSDYEEYKKIMEFEMAMHYSPHNIIFINQNKKDEIIEESTRYQVLPGYGMYFELDEEGEQYLYGNSVDIEQFNPFGEYDDVVLFNNKQVGDLTTNDVIVPAEYFYYNSINNFFDVYSSFIDEIIDLYVTDLAKRPILLNYIFEEFGETSLGNESMVAMYASMYVEEMLGLYSLPSLYLINKYEPTRPGKYYVDQTLAPILNSLYSNQTALLKTIKGEFYDNEVIATQTLNIAGVNLNLLGSYSSSATTYFHEDALVAMPLFLNSGYDLAIAKMPNDRAAIKKLVNLHFTANSEGFNYALINDVAQTMDIAIMIFEVINQVLLGLAIGFAVFASLLLMNFIALSVAYKKQEIGILRAIGARGNDVAAIFVLEATVIALIDFLISVVLVAFAVVGINGIIRNDLNIPITLLHFGIRQIGLLLGVALIIAYLSSVIPVYRISKKRPIDAIRNT